MLKNKKLIILFPYLLSLFIYFVFPLFIYSSVTLNFTDNKESYFFQLLVYNLFFILFHLIVVLFFTNRSFKEIKLLNNIIQFKKLELIYKKKIIIIFINLLVLVNIYTYNLNYTFLPNQLSYLLTFLIFYIFIINIKIYHASKKNFTKIIFLGLILINIFFAYFETFFGKVMTTIPTFFILFILLIFFKVQKKIYLLFFIISITLMLVGYKNKEVITQEKFLAKTVNDFYTEQVVDEPSKLTNRNFDNIKEMSQLLFTGINLNEIDEECEISRKRKNNEEWLRYKNKLIDLRNEKNRLFALPQSPETIAELDVVQNKIIKTIEFLGNSICDRYNPLLQSSFTSSFLNGYMFEYFVAKNYYQTTLLRIISRFDHAKELFIVLAYHNFKLFKEIDTFSIKTIIYKPIPRFLLQNKPEENYGNFFGRKYNFLGTYDFITSINVHPIIESYIIWGLIGLIFYSIFVLFFITLMSSLLNSNINNLFFFSLLGKHLYFNESNISLSFGGAIQCLIFYFILLFIINYFLKMIFKPV